VTSSPVKQEPMMTRSPALSVLHRMAAQIRIPRLRLMRQFAEEEIVLPTGPHQGRKYQVDRNPFAGLLLDALEDKRWSRKFVIGVQQSGKTLLGSLVPLMYHVFERKETVVFGIPSRDMIKDKWEQDILPVIAASRYRDFLPRAGQGSRGGTPMMVQFAHGPVLRFMTAGGNDKSRAGFTSRVLIATEVDGFDEVGGNSRETDKFGQLEGRVRAFTKCQPLVYGECTVSIDSGRIWREYSNGTESRLAIRCPHCRAFVTPAREQLVGWHDAPDIITAGEKAVLCCPGCGAAWSEADRTAANRDCRLVHKGQSVNADGFVEGDSPRTDTLGFRWTAANNLLVDVADVGREEWRAKQDPDEENAEKKLLQFVWALPHKPEAVDLTQLDAQVVTQRVTKDPRGRVPSDARGITIGIDVGQWLCHWAALSWRDESSCHVTDYGVLEVKSDLMEKERALLAALRDFRDTVCEKGWESDVGAIVPHTVLIDSGWAGEESEHLNEVIYAFCRESNEKCLAQRYFPAKGWSAGRYHHPREKDKWVRQIGEQWHAAKVPRQKGVRLVHVNVDHWKTKTHNRLRTPIGQTGAMTLYAASSKEHLSVAKHLTAEKQIEDFVPGRGRVIRWEMIRRANHYLDAAMLAQVGGNRAGAELFDETDEQRHRRKQFARAASDTTMPPADGPASTTTLSAEETAPTSAPDRSHNAGRGDGRGGWFAKRKRR
jgi:phage terminase large subunit GpA-like protein